MDRSQHKTLRQTYGFDDVALVPGDITINPDQTDISFAIDKLSLSIPILASAMDGVVDVRFAIAMGKLGGLAVLNLEGVQTRYNDPDERPGENRQCPAAGSHSTPAKDLFRADKGQPRR